MRLQLDSSVLTQGGSGQLSSAAAAVQPQKEAVPAGYRSAESIGSGDSIGISGPSTALSRLSTERAARIQQLTAAVRSDTYRVPASALSSSIVTQAFT